MKLSDFFKLTPPTPKSVKIYPRRHWTATMGNLETTGPDVDAALLAMQKKITTAFTGSYTPYALPFRGWLGLAWRNPQGWEYHFYNLAEEFGPKEGTAFLLRSCNSADTEKEIVNNLRRHLADVAWDWQEETSPIIIDQEDQQSFGRQARWQKRYKELAAGGTLDDTAIREQLLRENL